VAVEPDSSVHAEVPDKSTGAQLPSVYFQSRGIEDPSNEHSHDTIINMYNLAFEMFPFEVESCITPSLHAVLPGSPSDERACIAVGSSSSQTNEKHMNNLANAISKLALAIESQAAPKSSKMTRDKALSAEIESEKEPSSIAQAFPIRVL